MMYILIFWIVCNMVVVHCDDDPMWYDATEAYLPSFLVWKCPNRKCTGSNIAIQCCELSNITFSTDAEVTSANIAVDNNYDEYYYHRNGPVSAGSLNNITIENSILQKIPKGLFKIFKSPILLIIRSGLRILKINDFSGAERLVQLDLTYNEIENLEPNLFIYASNLQKIYLSNNRITDVSKYTFENLPNLVILKLSNNFIKTFDLKSTLINLRIFDISNNSLTYLTENLFQESKFLTDLSLNNNKLNISKLNVHNVLQVFDMSNNPNSIYLPAEIVMIKNSNTSVLAIDKKATSIDASENQIISMIVDPENKLLELNLSKNNCTSMQNLTALTSITKLDLSFNRIQDFSITSFANMRHLETLNLENCGFATIDFGIFSHQNKLTWLDISYNNLQTINFNMLTNSLESLFIEGNGLTSIDLNDILLPHLTTLGLSNNKFSCEKLAEIRKRLNLAGIKMHVDETTIVKLSTNIDGIGCLSENSTETLEFRSNRLPPIHIGPSNHNAVMETIEMKIKEIENNILRYNASFTEAVNSKDEILSLRQDMMNIQNDVALKLINSKADILMSVSSLFNISENKSIQLDLKSTIEEVNKINLGRFQLVSSQIKLVSEKLENLVQRMTGLDAPNVLQFKHDHVAANNDRQDSFIGKNEGIELSSIKGMMTFIIVTMILLIIGFTFIILYKRFYSQKRRFPSTNTINTNIEQSLV